MLKILIFNLKFIQKLINDSLSYYAYDILETIYMVEK